MSASVELFSPGSLGTCWYGKYHYMEPWVGCEHACPYCYARSRLAVNNSLRELGGEFGRPALLLPRPQLLQAIEERVNSGEINILKLCRFTDIFTPCYVADGLAAEIMRILAASKLQRVIITTKGVPDSAIEEIIGAHPQLFSYNVAVHPAAILQDSPLSGFDKNLHTVAERLDAAARIQSAGVQTTVHLDPFVATIDDEEQTLAAFLEELMKRGLKRVMWSYLLLSAGIMDSVESSLSPEVWQGLLQRYNLTGSRRVLPGQDDTISFAQNEEVALASVDKIYNALSEGGFEFVLCSLKSIAGLRGLKKYPKKMICDGTFYA